jgi:tripartite-type tricarboxylate transporter receptor subunit TctC
VAVGMQPWSAFAQGYPSKPVRLVVPFPPGGTADPVGRTLAEALGPRLGQTVVVDNRAGAGSMLGIDHVAKSIGDGYTLALGSSDGFSLLPVLRAKMPYDSVKDFTPVALVTQSPMVFVVNDKVPAKTMAELVALAKARPNSIRFGSAGIGTILQLTVEMLMAETGVSMVHIPYKGGGPATQDTVGGQIELMATGISGVVQFIASGALRALAVTGSARHPLLPNVPTTAEAGFPKVSAVSWFGVLVPAATPADTVDRLQREVLAVASQASFKQRMIELGCEGNPMPRENFSAFLAEKTQIWRRVVAAAQIPPLE